MSVLKALTEEAQLPSKKAEVLRDYRTFTSSQASPSVAPLLRT
jgi:hypothetical protein